MQKKRSIENLITKEKLTTKVKIFFATKSSGDDYDPYEANSTFTNLNPITIKAYVHEITPEQAFYKQYGLHQSGMLEIICDERFRNLFEICNKIEINSIEYQTFKAGTGGRTTITKRPFNTIRVILSRKD
jgi:hypothetical protein